MMRAIQSVLLTVVAATAPLSAQAVVAPKGVTFDHSVPVYLAIGDIVLNSNSDEVRVMPETGFVSHPFHAGVKHSDLIWDPLNPDSFIVSGRDGGTLGFTGRLHRMTVGPNGALSHQLLAGPGPFGEPIQLAFDQSGERVIVFDNKGQIYRVELSTGLVTELSSGNPPWGGIVGGAVDPLTGDFYIGNGSGEIWRRASNGSVSLFASGLTSPSSTGVNDDIGSMLVDSSSDPHYLYYSVRSAYERIDLAAPMSEPEVYFEQGFPNAPTVRAAAFDHRGDILLRDSFDQVWRLDTEASIPSSEALPQYRGQADFPSSASVGGIAVAGGTTQPFRLSVEPADGVAPGLIEVENVPQGTSFGWILASRSTFLAEGTGPMFGLVPDGLTFNILALAPQPGGIAFTGVPPASIPIPPQVSLPFVGETWDFVVVSMSGTGAFLGRSNLERITW